LRPFQRRSDLELDEATDEEVVDYLVAARDAGEEDEIATALRLLVFGRMPYVEAMVARKVPDHAVDRVAGEAMFSAMKAAFQGESVGQFVNFLRAVTERRIADYWTSSRALGREAPTLDDDEDRRAAVDTSEAIEAVVVQAVVDTVLESEFPRADHQRVIDLAVFADLPTREVCDRVNAELPGLDPPMSANNVDQVKSRFRKVLRIALSDGDTE
jgi:DNA-directed RNA polymerase specialized sigma24 family protein